MGTKTPPANAPFSQKPSALDAMMPNSVPRAEKPRPPMILGVVPRELVEPVSPQPAERHGPVDAA